MSIEWKYDTVGLKCTFKDNSWKGNFVFLPVGLSHYGPFSNVSVCKNNCLRAIGKSWNQKQKLLLFKSIFTHSDF